MKGAAVKNPDIKPAREGEKLYLVINGEKVQCDPLWFSQFSQSISACLGGAHVYYSTHFERK
jgi:hypothetical protein